MKMLSTLCHLFHPQRSNNHRPKVLHPEAYIAFSILIVVFSLSLVHLPSFVGRTGNVLGFASSITAGDVLAQTNQEREKQGLQTLTINTRLNEAAIAKAQHMLEQQYWAHTSPDGTQPWKFFKQVGYKYSVAGENLARDFGTSGDMMQAWMNSPTHKANIVSPKYKEIGIAVVDGTLLGTETTLVVQLFGSAPQAPAQITKAAPPQELKVVAEKLATSNPEPETLDFVQLEPVVPSDLVGNADVLGGESFLISNLQTPALFSPLQLMKAFFLAIIFLVMGTLIYDTVIMSHRNTVRLVGKNFAHLLFFGIVTFLLLFFKAGIIG